MKRLISELYQGYKLKDDYNDYVEFFKNPTSREINSILNDGLNIRGLLYKNGDLYIWPNLYVHGEVSNWGLGLDMTQYHISVESRDFIRFDSDNGPIIYDEFKSALVKNLTTISKFININSARLMINGMNVQGITDKSDETTFDKFLNYKGM